DGMRYRVLVLPETRFMTPSVLHKIRDLARAGATVVGPRPTQSPSLSGYPQCDAEVRRVASEVWGESEGTSITEHAYGSGRVIWGRPLAKVLSQLGAGPDFEYRCATPQAHLAYLHRVVGDTELYFVS